MKEQQVFASDSQIRYLQNALYTPIDMTDYEDQFVSWKELPGALPIAHSEKLLALQQEDFPQLNATVEKQLPENPPYYSTGATATAVFEAARAEPEEEEDDEEEEEEGEEEEYGEEEYGEEAEEEAPPTIKPEREWPAKEIIKHADLDNRVFRGDEKLRKRFNDVEIDNFMKLLAIKPHKQWQDTSFFHHKLGIHDYEDFN